MSQGVFAADDKGQFALRGAGLLPCAIYVKEREAKSEAYLMTAGWIDGFITGSNQYSPETYDLLSFETTELLTAILDKHCIANPKDRVFAVLKSLFQKLHQDRLQTLSEKTEVAVGDRKTSLYVEVLKRIQKTLTAKGLYKGKVNGSYDQSTIDAMKAFQRSVKLEPTGFPDQVTLWRLLRSDD
ncbi:MAG: peptidoglycan-binding domain-containing protein [Gammaproteobacteria bacterium]|nr:peptidoglycan-binding domain-containing protein [Gammaproteobacteria bacterium]